MANGAQIEVWRAPPDIAAQWCHEVTSSVPLHLHGGVQVAALTSGEVDVRVAGDSHRARAGDLVVLNAEQPHALDAVEGTAVTARIIEVGASRLGGWLGVAEPCFRDVVVSEPTLLAALEDVHAQLIAGASQDALEALEDFFGALFGLFGNLEGGASPSDTRLERVRALLRERMDQRCRLDELAEAVNADKFQLVRAFRRRFGMTPIAYQLQLRVESAKDLIAQGIDLAEVACRTGFADQSHLSRHFRRITLMTPGTYAKQVNR
ncbi:MAG: AraC family transcriptional regulator [Myxococcota bacterium]